MKKLLLTALLPLAMSIGAQAQEIEWMTFAEAVEANANGDTRPIFIDVYTDWCGWCKKMDASTFGDRTVAKYMNENFLNVKLDAEQRESIEFGGTEYKYVAQGRRGYHELAANLLQGKMSYPTVVFLDGEFNMLSPVPGYQAAGQFLTIARYFGDGIYQSTSWEEYSGQKKADG